MTDTILRGPTPPVPAGTPATPGSEPSEGAFAHLFDARLGADLAAHAANLAADECRFSLMVEEVDRRGFGRPKGQRAVPTGSRGAVGRALSPPESTSGSAGR